MNLAYRLLMCAMVGAGVGTVHALTRHDGPTAWNLAKVALILAAAAVLVDLARKLVSR